MAIAKRRKKAGSAVKTANKIRNINNFLSMARTHGVELSAEYQGIIKLFPEEQMRPKRKYKGKVQEAGVFLYAPSLKISTEDKKAINKIKDLSERSKAIELKQLELQENYDKFVEKLEIAYNIYRNTQLNEKTSALFSNFYNRLEEEEIEGITMESILDYANQRDAGRFKELLKHLPSDQVVEVIQVRKANKVNRPTSFNDELDWIIAWLAKDENKNRTLDANLIKDFLKGEITIEEFEKGIDELRK